MKQPLLGLTLIELTNLLQENKIKTYVAKQLFSGVYRQFYNSIDDISTISKNAKQQLNDLLTVPTFTIVKQLTDKDNTIKYLIKLADGNLIETVIMEFDYGYSVCISTQIGCNMKCAFCASGRLTKIRDLTVDEIVIQVRLAKEQLTKLGKRLTNVVVMGIGEPLDNFDNLNKAIEIIIEQYGLGIGKRHITISTCGLTEKMIEFSRIHPQVNIAISLHAPNDEIRNKMMPINRKHNINDLIRAAKECIRLTNRRISFEYILIKGINDQPQHAELLAKLLKNILCYVNLIPCNPIPDSIFQKSINTDMFFNILKINKIQATIRLERGTNISAACGQLRAQATINNKK